MKKKRTKEKLIRARKTKKLPHWEKQGKHVPYKFVRDSNGRRFSLL